MQRYDCREWVYVWEFISDEDEPLPVIRMVFALGSDDSGITFPAQENSNLGASTFTSYDITFGVRDCSSRTFACVRKICPHIRPCWSTPVHDLEHTALTLCEDISQANVTVLCDSMT